MAGSTGDVVSHDYPLSDLKVGDGSPLLNNCAGQFMSQHYWRWGLLRNLENVRATESTAMYLYEQFRVGNGWNRPVFYANVVIGVVDYCVHSTSNCPFYLVCCLLSV